MLGIPINEQTVGGAVLLAVLLLAVGFGTAVVWITACVISRWLRARRHDDAGPDVLEELAALINDYALDNPDLEAGFARLLADIHDEQQEGEQA